MEKQINNNPHLIESLLSVLDAPNKNSAGSEISSTNSHSSDPVSEALRIQAAQEIKQLMDQMPGGFFIYHADEEERLIYANTALLRIFNCNTIEEFRHLTGNSFRGIVHPDDLEEVEKSIQEQIAQSRYDLDYVEYRIIQKGGAVRWVEDYGHFVRSNTVGDIFYVFIGDATEKKRQIEEEHLQRLEVIEGLSINYESILYADLDEDKILSYRLSSRTSHQFPQVFHKQPYRQFISEYIKEWVHAEDRNMVAEAISPEQIRSRLTDSKTFYVNFRTVENHVTQYLQLRIANVGNTGHTSRIVLGSRRIDEEIRHEIEQKKIFEDAWNQARLANIAKSTFLSNMSHDMRTPLNAITGFTALARKNIDDREKSLDYLDKIDASSDHLLRLVKHILEISRIESGAVEVVEVESCLEDIIKTVENNILPRAKAKHITFSVEHSSLEHNTFYCDSEKLSQILIYLSGNAIKYTDTNGHVLLTVSEEKEPSTEYAVYHFSVKDDGIGIEEQYMKRIFEPFERVSNTTFCGVYGTGLGLTLAKNLVEMMSGNIDVDSVPGLGSTFTVTLRLRVHNTSDISFKEARKTVLNLIDGRRILLVDDNELNLEIETELLRDMGLNVDTAPNGQVAVNRIADSAPEEYALILMDIQMPVMNGHEAALAIRRLEDPVRANIPIIALSANAFDEDRRMSRESGMNTHMEKPIDLPKLMELIASILHSCTGDVNR